MLIGGVTPFGLPADLPIWVDARVVERPRIVLGGSRSCKVVGPPALLTAQPTVEVVQDLAVEVPSADGRGLSSKAAATLRGRPPRRREGEGAIAMGAELLDRAYAATGAVLANVTPDQLDLRAAVRRLEGEGPPQLHDRRRLLLRRRRHGPGADSGVRAPDYSAGDYRDVRRWLGAGPGRLPQRRDMERTMKPPFGEVPGSVFVMIAAGRLRPRLGPGRRPGPPS